MGLGLGPESVPLESPQGLLGLVEMVFWGSDVCPEEPYASYIILLPTELLLLSPF